MPRPQTYTDSEIEAAAQALIAEGGDINPMRVRMRLGGGNVNRIKAVIANMPRQEVSSPLAASLPQPMVREFQKLISEVSQRLLSIVAEHWVSGAAGSTDPAREGSARLRKQLDSLKGASSKKLAQAESQRDQAERSLKKVTEERAELTQSLGRLQAALRNAESDLRAAQRMIDSFERNRREDRDEIQGLQRRIEALVGEVAILKAKASGEQQESRARAAKRSSSHPR